MHVSRRDGVDAHVAFANTARAQASCARRDTDAATAPAASAADPPAAEGSRTQPEDRGPVARLVAPVRSGFGLRGPIRRAAAYTRRYFTDPVRQDLRQHADARAEDIRAEIAALRHALQQSVSTLSEVLRRDMQRERALATDALTLAHQRQMAELAAVRRDLRLASGPPEDDGMARPGPPAEQPAMYQGAPGELLVATPAGLVVCPAGDYELLGRMRTGTGPAGVTGRLIERLVRPGQTVVDTDAGVGLHVLAAARGLAGAGRIVAVEPGAANRDCLAKTCRLNGIAHLTEIPPVTDPAGTLAALADRRVDVVRGDADGPALRSLSGAAALLRGNPELVLILDVAAAESGGDGAFGQLAARAGDLGLAVRALDAGGRPVAAVVARRAAEIWGRLPG